MNSRSDKNNTLQLLEKIIEDGPYTEDSDYGTFCKYCRVFLDASTEIENPANYEGDPHREYCLFVKIVDYVSSLNERWSTPTKKHHQIDDDKIRRFGNAVIVQCNLCNDIVPGTDIGDTCQCGETSIWYGAMNLYCVSGDCSSYKVVQDESDITRKDKPNDN